MRNEVNERVLQYMIQALPFHAPDLTPEEGIWRFLKSVELKNICCYRLAELSFKADVILGCLANQII